MNIKTNRKMVEITEEIFIAFDGKEFESKQMCMKYENELNKEKLIKAAEQMKIERLDDFLPIDTSGSISDNNIFIWYQVNNMEDLEMLNKAYSNSFIKPEIFPEVYCIETCGHEAYKDDSYEYRQSEMFNLTKEFWEKLGYEVDFRKIYKEEV